MASTLELFLLAQQSGQPSVVALPYTTSGQTFTLASQVAVTGLSATLPAGAYLVEARVEWVPSATVGSSHYHGFTFSGTASSVAMQGVSWQTQSANAILQTTVAGVSSLSATMFGTPTHVAFSGWTEINGTLVVSAPGTLAATIQLAAAGDDVITYAGSWLRVTLIP
jgi:hypothetical protein